MMSAFYCSAYKPAPEPLCRCIHGTCLRHGYYLIPFTTTKPVLVEQEPKSKVSDVDVERIARRVIEIMREVKP